MISLEESTDGYTICVEDDGLGIQSEFEEKLFKAMQTTKGAKGTGHGLYLCKLLVENKLGGSIHVHSLSTPTVFSLFLPKGNSWTKMS